MDSTFLWPKSNWGVSRQQFLRQHPTYSLLLRRIFRVRGNWYNVFVSCPKTERAEVAAYQTGSNHAVGKHRTIDRPSFARSICIHFGRPSEC